MESSDGVKAAPEVPWLMWLGTEETVRKMDEELKLIKGKGAEAIKEQVAARYLGDGRLCSVDREAVTKTQLQYLQTTIPEEEMSEIGQAIGNDMLAIRESSKNNFWPQDGGVRFPNAVCGWCAHRGLCLKQTELVEQLLVQIKPAELEQERDWLDDLDDGE